MSLWQTSLKRVQERFTAAGDSHGEAFGLLVEYRDPTAEELRDGCPLPPGFLDLRLDKRDSFRPPGESTGWVSRRHFVAASRTTANFYDGLSVEAGRCLSGAPKQVAKQLLPGTLQTTDDGLRWTCLLYDLGWRKVEGSPLQVDKFTWCDSHVFLLATLPELRRSYNQGGLVKLLDEIFAGGGKAGRAEALARIPDPPRCLYSTIPDLFRASIYAVDILLSLTAPHRGMPASTPAHLTGKATAPKAESEEPTNRYDGLDRLTPTVQKAYLSFVYAESKREKRLEDREAYDWLIEYGIDASKGEAGELVDYGLPAFATWSRYLREARKATGEQKYTPRHARPTGRSVVLNEQIEHQHPTGE